MSISIEQINAASATKPKVPSYIDSNKPTPTVIDTNLPPDFFTKIDIDPASVVSAGISIHVGYKHGEPAKFSLTSNANQANLNSNSAQVSQNQVKDSLLELGAQRVIHFCTGC